MTGRPRRGQGITGPHSALTDFLATHNISASTIREEYQARLRAAEAQAGPSSRADEIENEEDEEVVDEDAEEAEETPQQARKRKRKEQAAIAKIKKSKAFARQKAGLDGEPGGDDDDGLAFDMYSKTKALPGQMENCEECEKRFTVTPYTKEGPNGGLLCAKCGKIQEDAKKKNARVKKTPVTRGKGGKAQSNIMDGHAALGTKTLLEICVERVAKSIDDIEDFGDLPPALYDRLSMLLSKHRVLDSRILDLFLQSENDSVAIYDCGKLSTDDFIRIFQVCPNVTKIDLRQCGQFKDNVLDFILERKMKIRELRLDAANLITDIKWQQFFQEAGSHLESLQLSWLDFAMMNDSVKAMLNGCPNLKRLKLKRCFHLDDDTLNLLANKENLEHLSLSFVNPTTPECLTECVAKQASTLISLCLRDFTDANDTLLETLQSSSGHLKKLVISNNDRITDAAYESLFTNWHNPALVKANFSSSRDTESAALARSNEEEEEDPSAGPQIIGLASAGFTALMRHSGNKLQKLNIASCRSISHSALLEVFDGNKTYPDLTDLDISFISVVDTAVVAGIFKSCPKLTKLVAFGCFDISGVIIPRGIALIGVPATQDGIVQEGDATVDDAVDRMDID